MAGVVIDTSFLITLAGSSRKHHDAARKYWRHFAEENIPIFLPTIVVSEFCIKQEIPPEILRCCVVLPFNWSDAMKAAELDFTQWKGQSESRDALKDDIKIIAQAIVSGASYLITDDTQSLYRFATVLKTSGKAQFKAVKLEDGFDRAFFDSNGQRDFTDQLEESDEPGS